MSITEDKYTEAYVRVFKVLEEALKFNPFEAELFETAWACASKTPRLERERKAAFREVLEFHKRYMGRESELRGDDWEELADVAGEIAEKSALREALILAASGEVMRIYEGVCVE